MNTISNIDPVQDAELVRWENEGGGLGVATAIQAMIRQRGTGDRVSADRALINRRQLLTPSGWLQTFSKPWEGYGPTSTLQQSGGKQK